MLVLPNGLPDVGPRSHLMATTDALDIAAKMSPTLSKVRPSIRGSTPLQGGDHSSVPWLQILVEVVATSSERETSLTEDCVNLIQKYDGYEKESSTLKRNYEGLQQEQRELSLQLTSFENETQAIKAQLAQCEENKKEHQELSKRFKALQESSTELESRLSHIETEKIVIEGKLGLCNQHIQDLENEVNKLVSTIEEHKQRIAALEEGLQEAQEQYRTSELKLSASVKDVSALRGNLNSTETELLGTKNLLEQSNIALDGQMRDSHFYQFVPALDQKIWMHLITIKCEKIKSPLLLACYLVSALFRYTVYKLYSQWLLQNQLKHAYQMHLTSDSFKQETSSIKRRVIEKFVGQSVNAQQAFSKTHG